ncbi:MAG TPA: hypothetical protein PLR10_08725, partial [Smithella sp.]|nr:hypothetical protein [Smithella sp.]
ENLKGVAGAILSNMKAGRYASEYDVHIAMKIAHVLGGGTCAEGTWITEQEMLDLEIEAFMSLCGEQKTQDRIAAMLTNGKPLRN